jgi:hypothetical protein
MLVLFYLLAFCVERLVAVDTVVDLGYAKYRGLDFGNGVTRWAGMRYARSTSRLDGLRFTAPQDPLDVEGTVNATEVRDFSAPRLHAVRLTELVWTSLHWNEQSSVG